MVFKTLPYRDHIHDDRTIGDFIMKNGRPPYDKHGLSQNSCKQSLHRRTHIAPISTGCGIKGQHVKGHSQIQYAKSCL